MKVRIGQRVESKQCAGCLKHFPTKRLWRLPYAGSRCTECALRFLNFYKEHATRGILNILNRDIQVTKKTAAAESSRCSIEEPSKCSSCG
jgi:hypothetical protein